MRHLFLSAAVALVPAFAEAEAPQQVIANVVSGHILAGFDTLAAETEALALTAQTNCDTASQDLRSSFASAFDAWLSVSHLRFGPSEAGDRAFALAFWPDTRGATPRALAALIADRDPVAEDAASYAQVSIAARGFYAMEFLVFDEGLSADAAYLCTLVQSVTGDMAATSAAIAQDWNTDYADRLLNPSATGTYRSDTEVLQELFKALSTGLQFTSETRLGRPLGTFDRPRPRRAEAWRAGRSARNTALSLEALAELAAHLSAPDPVLRDKITARFDKALGQLSDLDDPVFAGVAHPQSRLKLEFVQQSVDAIRAVVRDELGPTLGVAAGFNSLDGD
ncbi:imelysin family protein [Sulfitobacter sp. HNIBRBA2951]|uniref:imelysin family protein n=1 Tax=Sulfitobacter aquimarinus TaxID=3158557 RepID=UPI0032DF68B9